MCRALRGLQQPSSKMSPPKTDYAANYYADRLGHLKRVLKPYRDNNVNRLRTVVGSGCRSARVNLNKHWKSLENLLAPNHRKERDQNAVNEKLQKQQQRQREEEDAENAEPSTTAAAAAAAADDDDPMTSDAAERLHALNVGR